MPLFHDLSSISNYYSGGSSSYNYLSGPYATHSSIVASNFSRPSPSLSKPISRNIITRGYKPHLATINETQAINLTRIKSPKVILHSSPKFKYQRPICINTADIDVSSNKYRKLERANLSSSPRKEYTKPEVTEEEFVPNPRGTIKRERTVVRFHTVRPLDRYTEKEGEDSEEEEPKKKLSTIKVFDEEIKVHKQKWRENFEPDELKLPPRTQKNDEKPISEKLKEKFMIKEKEEDEIAKLDEERKKRREQNLMMFNSDPPKIRRRPSKRQSIKQPTFHDICRSVSSEKIDDGIMNTPQIVRKYSRKYSDLNRQIRRNSAEINREEIQALDVLLKEANLDGLDNQKNEQGDQNFEETPRENTFEETTFGETTVGETPNYEDPNSEESPKDEDIQKRRRKFVKKKSNEKLVEGDEPKPPRRKLVKKKSSTDLTKAIEAITPEIKDEIDLKFNKIDRTTDKDGHNTTREEDDTHVVSSKKTDGGIPPNLKIKVGDVKVEESKEVSSPTMKIKYDVSIDCDHTQEDVWETKLQEEQSKMGRVALEIKEEQLKIEKEQLDIKGEKLKAALGASKVEQDKLDTSKVGESKLDTSKVGQSKLDTSKVGQSKLETSKIGQSKLETSKIGQSKLDASKIGQSKVDTAKTGQSNLDSSKGGQSNLDASKGGQSNLDASKGVKSNLVASKVGQSNLDASKGVQSNLDASKGGQSKLDTSKPEKKPEALKLDGNLEIPKPGIGKAVISNQKSETDHNQKSDAINLKSAPKLAEPKEEAKSGFWLESGPKFDEVTKLDELKTLPKLADSRTGPNLAETKEVSKLAESLDQDKGNDKCVVKITYSSQKVLNKVPPDITRSVESKEMLVEKTVEEPVKKSEEAVKKTAEEVVKKPLEEAAKKPLAEPVKKSVEEPVKKQLEPLKKPLVDSTKKLAEPPKVVSKFGLKVDASKKAELPKVEPPKVESSKTGPAKKVEITKKVESTLFDKQRSALAMKKQILEKQQSIDEPQEEDFWGKIGKRETINFKNRRKYLEQRREMQLKQHCWIEDEDTKPDEKMEGNLTKSAEKMTKPADTPKPVKIEKKLEEKPRLFQTKKEEVETVQNGVLSISSNQKLKIEIKAKDEEKKTEKVLFVHAVKNAELSEELNADVMDLKVIQKNQVESKNVLPKVTTKVQMRQEDSMDDDTIGRVDPKLGNLVGAKDSVEKKETEKKDTKVCLIGQKDSKVPVSGQKDSKIGEKDSKVSTLGGKDSKVSPLAEKDSKVSPLGGKDSKVSLLGEKDSKVSSIEGKDSKETPSKVKDSKVSPLEGKDSKVSPLEGKDSKVSPLEGKDSKVPPLQSKDSKVPPLQSKDSKVSLIKGKDSKVPPLEEKDSKVTPAEKDSKVAPAEKDSKVAPSAKKDSKVSPSAEKDSKVSSSVEKDSKVSSSAEKDSKASPSAGKDSKVSPLGEKDSKVSPLGEKDSKASFPGEKDSKAGLLGQKGLMEAPLQKKGLKDIPSAKIVDKDQDQSKTPLGKLKLAQKSGSSSPTEKKQFTELNKTSDEAPLNPKAAGEVAKKDEKSPLGKLLQKPDSSSPTEKKQFTELNRSSEASQKEAGGVKKEERTKTRSGKPRSVQKSGDSSLTEKKQFTELAEDEKKTTDKTKTKVGDVEPKSLDRSTQDKKSASKDQNVSSDKSHEEKDDRRSALEKKFVVIPRQFQSENSIDLDIQPLYDFTSQPTMKRALRKAKLRKEKMEMKKFEVKEYKAVITEIKLTPLKAELDFIIKEKFSEVLKPNTDLYVPSEASYRRQQLEKMKEQKPDDQKEEFVPLQSNQILGAGAKAKPKPVWFDECPVVIMATPRDLRKRIVAHRPPPPPSDSESESESEEESEEETSSESTDESDECTDKNVNIAKKNRKSTSSNDSGFDSSAPGSPANNRNATKECDVNCHKKCEKLTANLCGVNQKMIVEALSSVKKGSSTTSSSDTRDSTPNPAHNPAFALEGGDPALECSQAYTAYQRSGRVTPPATSIPRFRKYTVEDFCFLKVLGKGSFGKVLLAELKNTEYYYAVKCLKKDIVLEDDDVECTLIERKVLALGTKHPYLCHLFCTFQTESHLFFVMEYLNGGDLMFHIQTSGRFQEPRARFYAAEIVSGLKFLHGKGIVYRDLKLDNILLDFDGHVRIADFGMCKLQIFLDRTADTFCGTPDYMAPEIIKGQHYNQSVDWWSFGVLLYEMLIGQSPFSGGDEDELFWSICNERPVFPRFLSAEATEILNRLLDKDSSKRLGNKYCPYGNIMDQPFFTQIEWDKLEKRQLEPPFKPKVQHPLDTQYFDKAFTAERVKLTPVEKDILHSMDQSQFHGFSYTNPNATDR